MKVLRKGILKRGVVLGLGLSYIEIEKFSEKNWSKKRSGPLLGVNLH